MTRHSFWLRALAALLLLCGGMGGLVLPAAAHRGGDAGAYQILGARYGTPRYNVDVTQRLQVLARRDRSFVLDNKVMGIDPHPNRVKTLRIFARGSDGAARIFDYVEGSVVDGARFSSWGAGRGGPGGWGGGWGGDDRGRPVFLELQIVSAQYGEGRDRRDVAGAVRDRVRHGQLALRVDNETLGMDPVPNRPKTLRLSYTVGEGRLQWVEVPENRLLNLP